MGAIFSDDLKFQSGRLAVIEQVDHGDGAVVAQVKETSAGEYTIGRHIYREKESVFAILTTFVDRNFFQGYSS